MNKRRHLLLAMLFCCCSWTDLGFARFENSVVKLTVTKQEVDHYSPWKRENIDSERHLAVLVTGRRLLTTAFAVKDHMFIEIERFGSVRRHPARVVFVDYESNLAVVEPESAAIVADMTPVALGPALKVDEEASIYRARDAYQMARIPARLENARVDGMTTSAYQMLTYQFKVQSQGMGWSEPIFRGNQLVGLATGQNSFTVHALPAVFIKHFLDDSLDENYRGFASAGIGIHHLDAPALRQWLGADKVKGGIRVSKLSAGRKEIGDLQVNDVVLQIDGISISEHGYFDHPQWGKIALNYLINRRYAGDTMDFIILRQGERKTVSVKLLKFDSNNAPVPYYHYEEEEPYLILGGIVIRRLTRSYLKQWGADWAKAAPERLVHAYMVDSQNDAAAGREYLMVAQVLPDVYNRGYEDLKHRVIGKINGQPIHQFADVERALRQHPIAKKGRHFFRIHIEDVHSEVILEYDGLAEAHQRLQATYGLPPEVPFFKMTKTAQK